MAASTVFMGSVTKTGPTSWTVRFRDLSSGGTFQSLRDGQQQIENSGGGALLQWSQEPYAARAGAEVWQAKMVVRASP